MPYSVSTHSRQRRQRSLQQQQQHKHIGKHYHWMFLLRGPILWICGITFLMSCSMILWDYISSLQRANNASIIIPFLVVIFFLYILLLSFGCGIIFMMDIYRIILYPCIVQPTIIQASQYSIDEILTILCDPKQFMTYISALFIVPVTLYTLPTTPQQRAEILLSSSSTFQQQRTHPECDNNTTNNSTSSRTTNIFTEAGGWKYLLPKSIQKMINDVTNCNNDLNYRDEDETKSRNRIQQDGVNMISFNDNHNNNNNKTRIISDDDDDEGEEEIIYHDIDNVAVVVTEDDYDDDDDEDDSNDEEVPLVNNTKQFVSMDETIRISNKASDRIRITKTMDPLNRRNNNESNTSLPSSQQKQQQQQQQDSSNSSSSKDDNENNMDVVSKLYMKIIMDMLDHQLHALCQRFEQYSSVMVVTAITTFTILIFQYRTSTTAQQLWKSLAHIVLTTTSSVALTGSLFTLLAPYILLHQQQQRQAVSPLQQQQHPPTISRSTRIQIEDILKRWSMTLCSVLLKANQYTKISNLPNTTLIHIVPKIQKKVQQFLLKYKGTLSVFLLTYLQYRYRKLIQQQQQRRN